MFRNTFGGKIHPLGCQFYALVVTGSYWLFTVPLVRFPWACEVALNSPSVGMRAAAPQPRPHPGGSRAGSSAFPPLSAPRPLRLSLSLANLVSPFSLSFAPPCPLPLSCRPCECLPVATSVVALLELVHISSRAGVPFPGPLVPCFGWPCALHGALLWWPGCSSRVKERDFVASVCQGNFLRTSRVTIRLPANRVFRQGPACRCGLFFWPLKV